jgi:NAD-dependent deacetylase
MKKHLVILSGAGMSAESGISTFRDSNGLWENHVIEEVATPEGFEMNPKLVLDFYNARRQQLFEVEPNLGHQLIADLEKDYKVSVVTQNVDDLHERAGNSIVIHLHGELRKVRSTVNPSLIYEWKKDLNIGDTCEEGSQLRPHIVWFGEAVLVMDSAIDIVQSADMVVVI